jgi:hypothetical protein
LRKNPEKKTVGDEIPRDDPSLIQATETKSRLAVEPRFP